MSQHKTLNRWGIQQKTIQISPYQAPEVSPIFYRFCGYLDSNPSEKIATSDITELNLQDGYIKTRSNSKYMLGSIDSDMLPYLSDHLLKTTLRSLITPQFKTDENPEDIISWIKTTTGLELKVWKEPSTMRTL